MTQPMQTGPSGLPRSIAGSAVWTRRTAGLLAPVAVAAALLLAPMSALPAAATHQAVSGYVYVIRDQTTVFNTSDDENCDATFCQVTVSAEGKRDYNRFVRWCGATFVDITVGTGDSFEDWTCLGPGAWYIYLTVALNPGGEAMHDSPVTVRINATP